MSIIGESLIKYDLPTPYLSSSEKMKKSQQAQKQSSNEDTLNQIILPRKFEQANEQWIQYVSSQPATRLDVLNLQEKLAQQLKTQQAREMGLCPIREDTYAQCFDELIRQVSVNSIERGILLAKVRDELQVTGDAYQSLYESAVAFGIRKTLLSEQGKLEMLQRVSELQKENLEIKKKVEEHKSKLDAAERAEQERRVTDEKKHADEIAYLKKQITQLKSQLENVLNV